MVRGSGRSPPCVTRWSGGAVVHDRGALLRRGLRRRTTTHHVVELGSQHYRGQFNVVPGTVFVWTPASHLLVRPEHGGRRRAVDALDGHRRYLVVVVQLLQRRRLVVPRGDGCTARAASAAWLATAAALFAVLLWSSASAEATARSASSLCASTADFRTAATLASVR